MPAVFVLIYRRAAISAFVRPSARRRRTSTSRLESSPRSLGPVLAGPPSSRTSAALDREHPRDQPSRRLKCQPGFVRDELGLVVQDELCELEASGRNVERHLGAGERIDRGLEVSRARSVHRQRPRRDRARAPREPDGALDRSVLRSRSSFRPRRAPPSVRAARPAPRRAARGAAARGGRHRLDSAAGAGEPRRPPSPRSRDAAVRSPERVRTISRSRRAIGRPPPSFPGAGGARRASRPDGCNEPDVRCPAAPAGSVRASSRPPSSCRSRP